MSFQVTQAEIDKALVRLVGNVTRVEIVEQSGRVYSKRSIGAELMLQDDNKTLKIFVYDNE